MLSRIEIDYPDFGVKVERDLTSGINLIEEANGYGKSTILNTILSLYSKKYPGLRTLPSGIAKVYTDEKVYMMSKGMWVGLEEAPNPLVRFCLPGEFFNMGSTTEQRKAIIDLLGIDYPACMKGAVPEWHEDIEKEIKDRMKQNEWREDVILADITRLKSAIIAYEKNPIVLEDNSQELYQEYNAYHAKLNTDRNAAISNNNNVVRQRNDLTHSINQDKRSIESMEAQVNQMRDEVNWLLKGTCGTCGQKVPVDQAKIDSITAKAKSIKTGIEETKKDISEKESRLQALVTADVPNEVPFVTDPYERAKIIGKVLKVNTVEERDAVSQYENNKRELTLKENQLKKLGEINDKVLLSSIDSAKKLFTKNLQDDIKDFNLEIELFKEQANGKLVESFIISLNGKPYGELSNGNKLLLQIRMALAFIKRLGLDFILIDELGAMSQANFDMVVAEVWSLQMIIARATPFIVPTNTDSVDVKPKKKSTK